MATDPYPSIVTLGEMLTEEAQRLVARRIPVPAWLRPFSIVMQHLTALPLPSEARFQRVEADIPSPFLPAALKEQLALNNPWPKSLASTPRVLAQGDNTKGMAPKGSDVFEDEGRDIIGHPRLANVPSQGLSLTPRVRTQLRETVGMGAEDIRIHEDEVSDEIANSNRADAVTVGQHIFFRRGQFRPHETEGLALLAHEATHVLNALRPDAAWRRATAAGLQEEEREALAREQEVRAALPGQVPREPHSRSIAARDGAGPAPFDVHTTLPGSWQARPPSPILQPMRADVGRKLDSTVSASPVPHPNKDVVEQILLDAIRRQIERGV